MVARVVAATEQDQREEWKVDTDYGGLQVSIHADLKQTGGLRKPEERQKVQPERQFKSMPMLKQKQKQNPDPDPNPKPNPALAP